MKYHQLLFFVVIAVFLYTGGNCDENKIEQAYKSMQVIPDVIDTFPSKKLEVKYTQSKKEVDLGNELAPKDVREIPHVHYDGDSHSFYTLAMVDPDAPSRKSPTRREFQHWMVVNVPGSNIKDGTTLSEYIGSGPPKDTGLHRYVFLLYKQPGKINFDEPHRDKHHASTRAKFSMKKFAEKHHLGHPIAGNFFQAQYDESVPELHKQFTA